MDDIHVLQRLGTGRFIGELGATLAEVADEVARTRRKGAVTVKFSISPGADDGVSVVVNEEIKRTPPVRDSRGAHYFALDGELHDHDPRQPTMDFHEVPKSNGAVVTVDDRSTVVSIQDAS